MSNEFEPYLTDDKKSEFSVWQYQVAQAPAEPEISPEEELARECELIRQEAREQGYSEGLQQAQAEITDLKAELARWIEFFQHPIQLLDEQLVQEVMQTVIWLSQYCIGVELSVNPEKLYDLLNEIKGELPSLKGNKILGMNPDDAQWIKAQISEKEMPGIEQSLYADPELNRGDFYLKGEHSELDGRLNTRLLTLCAKYINKDTLITPIKPQDAKE
ncbi:flagellar assembly protein FliH [Legionella shakespearei]|uniref:Flagellar assembly protein FliH n=1 Tax=Legionella shakespearei DSM 23087 TaxID=1122169 RepID=A0A0W0YR80_9GAMM|nr:flagellar assembly protein FliH [Legionella shakespearei]KTD59027.1 polar flagellar assembly protein FliH [Legionella shakespearei DSM 23087]